jgi:hypothetical protein
MRVLLIIAFMFASPCLARSMSSDEDAIAHFGISWGLAVSLSMGYRKAFELKPESAMLTGWISALTLGIIKEYIIDSTPNSDDMRMNALGTTMGTLFYWHFSL